MNNVALAFLISWVIQDFGDNAYTIIKKKKLDWNTELDLDFEASKLQDIQFRPRPAMPRELLSYD